MSRETNPYYDSSITKGKMVQVTTEVGAIISILTGAAFLILGVEGMEEHAAVITPLIGGAATILAGMVEGVRNWVKHRWIK